MEQITFQRTEVDRQTGQRYRIVKRYQQNGRFAEGNTHRRYELFKIYV